MWGSSVKCDLAWAVRVYFTVSPGNVMVENIQGNWKIRRSGWGDGNTGQMSFTVGRASRHAAILPLSEARECESLTSSFWAQPITANFTETRHEKHHKWQIWFIHISKHILEHIFVPDMCILLYWNVVIL